MFALIQEFVAPYARAILIGSVLLLVVLVGLILLNRKDSSGQVHLDSESIQKVTKGMSKEEVRAVIGAPPGHYSTPRDPNDKATFVRPNRRFNKPPGTKSEDYWEGTDRSLQVWYDADDVVIEVNSVVPK